MKTSRFGSPKDQKSKGGENPMMWIQNTMQSMGEGITNTAIIIIWIMSLLLVALFVLLALWLTRTLPKFDASIPDSRFARNIKLLAEAKPGDIPRKEDPEVHRANEVMRQMGEGIL